jgi:hypothetical protein
MDWGTVLVLQALHYGLWPVARYLWVSVRASEHTTSTSTPTSYDAINGNGVTFLTQFPSADSQKLKKKKQKKTLSVVRVNSSPQTFGGWDEESKTNTAIYKSIKPFLKCCKMLSSPEMELPGNCAT